MEPKLPSGHLYGTMLRHHEVAGFVLMETVYPLTSSFRDTRTSMPVSVSFSGGHLRGSRNGFVRLTNSHQPTRPREKVMRRFKSTGHAQQIQTVLKIRITVNESATESVVSVR
jgi:hypothetical protein